MKKFISTIIILAILCTSTTALAADTIATGEGMAIGEITINGAIEPTIVKVRHPVTLSYSLDPNNGALWANDFMIRVLCLAPIKVTINDFSSTSGGDITFIDVEKTAKTWINLNKEDSQKYIALSVSAYGHEDAWEEGCYTGEHYAAKTTPTTIGVIKSGYDVMFQIDGHHGFAFDQTYTAKHKLSFLFELA